MTSVTTTEFDLPARPAIHVSPVANRRRLRLDLAGPEPAEPTREPGAAAHRRRRSLCLTERILRNSPASLRTTMLLLIAVTLLGGVMVATLGFVGLALFVGLSALSWYQCHRRA